MQLPDTTEADVEAIKRAVKQEVTATNAGDLESFFAILSADNEIIPPNQPAVRGEQARQWLRDFMDQFTMQLEPYSNEEVVVAGDLAFHRYSFEWTVSPKGGGDSITERGAGIHILQRQQDGSWVLVKDIWNPETPPTAEN
jgi:ketosteroid isomerase-like protein